ncbi:MAG: hypothetical protein WC444_05530 [Candidatus Paceibacterota bacterium]
MAVATTTYGAWTTHQGTLAEVMAVIKGLGSSQILAIYYDTGASLHTAIVNTQSR